MLVKERLHELIEALPERELHTARRFLEYLAETANDDGAAEAAGRPLPQAVAGIPPFRESHDLDALAAEQGVKPVTNLDDLVGDFWPEDESIDDFIATIRRWRREG